MASKNVQTPDGVVARKSNNGSESTYEWLSNGIKDGVYTLLRPVVAYLAPDPYTHTFQSRPKMHAKPAHLSRVTMTEMVLPSYSDTRGFMYAGVLLGWIDIAAGIAAKRHAVHPCVTRSVDDVHFLQPIKTGDMVVIQASVNKAWKTSMEVGVRVETENPLSGQRRFVAHAYMTFVAMRPKSTAKTSLGRAIQDHEPVSVPQIIPVTAIEKVRFNMAEKRRNRRFEEKKRPTQQHLERMREKMREWSQGLRHETVSDAVVVQHPVLMTEPDNDGKETRALTPPPPLRPRRSLIPERETPTEKSMENSFAEMVELVLPQHANTLHITFGGKIMQWMESCCIASASRHARSYTLTASIDSLQFIQPTHVGEVVTIRSMVSRAFRSSIEVYVVVEGENLQTGEIYFTNDAFFTIVAVDAESVPIEVPKVVPHNQEEKNLYEGSELRRKKRLQERRELVERESPAVSSEDLMTSPVVPR
ncbi:hypothetical protein BZG36_03277 [Bifiguratus adelaidae]|uniref:HotDog ACOT-type domain-containing protein n=1 Tax=Bifiguratus adelaidae TaxID=1938954 RepID=A0A261XZZ3_9FUNG|nr:hypothetical protein BZG36_03277 [Bifiguratus adelaidae]